MEQNRDSLKPVKGAKRPLRRDVGLRGELILILLPTLTVLGVLGFIEVLSRQRILFASLASSAFLIYLDPQHGANAIRTLVVAHLTAAGLLTYLVFGHSYVAAGSATVLTIGLVVPTFAIRSSCTSLTSTYATLLYW
jgi:hypothetical protein